jgi:sec-independent protein translocase protein TatA
MPGWIGFPELLILLVVVLLVFGPKRLPEMGRSLGRGMREFKDSVTGNDTERPTPAQTQAQLPPAAEVPVAPVAPSREHDTTTPAP